METNQEVCQNCQNTLPIEAKYCPSCSQKVKTGKVTIREFVQEFFDTVFNLDSKLFQTLGGLFIPGKLTKEYFDGKRKSYAPPIRLFLVMLVLLLTIISYVIEDGNVDTNVIEFGVEEKLEKEYLEELERTRIEMEKDSLQGDFALVDSFLRRVRYKKETFKRTQTHTLYIFDREKRSFKKIEISGDDISNLTEAEFFKKYELEGVINKLLGRQMRKFNLDPNAFRRFLLGSFTWMSFLYLPFMAMVLKLLYWRRNKYFIEHLVFLFHVHSFIFLVFSLIILGQILPAIIRIAMGIGMIFYFIFAFKKVYEQNWGKTIGKIIFFSFSYLLGFTLFMLLFTFIGFLIF